MALTAHQTTTASAASASNAQAVDVNADGKRDIVWAGGSQGTTAFSYQISNGNGTFRSAVEVPGTIFGSVIAGGDFNNDGLPDIAYGGMNGDSAGGLAVALNAGGGAFLPATFTPIGSASQAFSTLEIGDVNNDGHLDAILDGTLLLGFGDGTFNAPGVPTPFFGPESANPYRLADLNGDGQLDVVYIVGSDGTGGICTALNVGSGNFGAPNCALSTTVPTPTAIALGDVNGDHKIDIVAVFESMSAGLDVFLGNGDGTFQPVMIANLPEINAELVELGDFTNDGNLDLLVWYTAGTTPSPEFTLLPGAGNGTFAVTGQVFPAGVSDSLDLSIAIGDFAGDGLLGFAMADTNTPGFDVVLATCNP